MSRRLATYIPFPKIWLLLVVLFFVQCNAQVSELTLTDSEMFAKMSGPPLTDKYGEISSIKVVYDYKTKSIYFINHHRYKLHHEFCDYLRGYEQDLATFNRMNYGADGQRQYLLGNINYVKSMDKYALELSPTDQMPVSSLVFFYHKISESSFIGDDLTVLLNNTRLIAMEENLKSLFPVILPSEIYKNIQYQGISKYTGFGTIRFIDNIEKNHEPLQPTDILVLKHTPLTLPSVAGIIVSELQTPLSHLTILGQNRKIPISALKGAFDNATIRQWDGKLVRYEVRSDSFSIQKISELPKTSMTTAKVKLQASLTKNTLLDIDFVTRNSSKDVGNKAANFGVLYHLSKKYDFKTPEGAFAIPFYFYDQHLKSSGAQALLDTLFAHPSWSDKQIKEALTKIRKQIKEGTLNTKLLSEVKQRMTSDPLFNSMRFRSSTNAEDALGFSGAGLYSSITGSLTDISKPVDKAIKQVWASLWSYAAFMERSYYKIDQSKVYMGVLVHRNFPDEAVNGVAITKNIYRQGNHGFVVNVQLGEESVVQPTPGVTCDQFICFPKSDATLYHNKTIIDVLTISNLNNGSLVMTEKEITHLANQLDLIKRYYALRNMTGGSYLDFGLDLEFKLQGPKRDLYIKQVRLYND